MQITDSRRAPRQALPGAGAWSETPDRVARPEEHVRELEQRAREALLPGEAARLYLAAAEIARERMKDLRRAEALLREALAREGGGTEAYRGLRLIYEQTQDAGAQVEVVERLAEGAQGAEAASLWLQAAELYDTKLQRRDRAVLCCQRALRAGGPHREAFRRIQKLLIAEGSHQAALESLDRERQSLPPEGLADEYATFAEHVAEDPYLHPLARRAVDAALALQSRHARAQKVQRALQGFPQSWRDRVRSLRAKLVDERDRKAAARMSLLIAKILCSYDRSAKAKVREAMDRCFLQWPGMPAALQFIEQAPSHAGLPEPAGWMERMAGAEADRRVQAELWQRAGVYRLTRSNDRDGALVAFRRALEAAPARADAASLAFELLLEKEQAPEAAALLERHAAALEGTRARVEVHLRLAELYERELKDPAAAGTHLEAALRLDPRQAGVARRLLQRQLEANSPAGAEALLPLALGVGVSPAEAIALCERVASACAESGDGARASVALTRALLLAPSDPALLERTVRQAKASGREGALAETLQKAVVLAPADASVRLWRELGRLWASLSRPSEARAAFGEVLRLSPGDAEATEALASLAAEREGPDEADPVQTLVQEALRLEASGADAMDRAAVNRRLTAASPDELAGWKRLASACAELQQWDEVARASERVVALLAVPEERDLWRVRLAQVWAERLGRKEDAAGLVLSMVSSGAALPAGALALLEVLSREGVRSDEISRVLAGLYARRGEHQGQVAALLVQLATEPSPEGQRQLLAQAAELQENRLADPTGALSLWLRAVGLAPGDDELRGQALRLARDVSGGEELLRVWGDLARAARDAELSRTLVLEAAALAEDLSAWATLQGLCELGLSRCGEDPELLELLARAQGGAGEVEAQEATLRRKVEASAPVDRAALWLELARTDEGLGRYAEAAAALEEAVSAGADSPEILERLCELAARGGDRAQLQRTLERALSLSQKRGDDGLATRLAKRRAQLLDQSGGDPDAAVKQYTDVLAKNPRDPEALAALEACLQRPEVRTEAARALLPAYEALGQPHLLLQALEILVEGAKAPPEKRGLLERIARLQLEGLRQPDLAFAALARALSVTPEDEALHARALEVARQVDAVDSYVEVVQDLLDSSPPTTRARLHRMLAEVQRQTMGDRGAAIAHLRSALELSPDDPELLERLRGLHLDGQEWAALAEVLERLADVTQERARKLEVLRQAAAVHEQRLWDKESAAACFRRIAELDATDEAAAFELERLCRETDQREGLVFALELIRAQRPGGQPAREATLRLAQLHAENPATLGAALDLCQVVLDAAPEHAGARGLVEGWAALPGPQGARALALVDRLLAAAGEHRRRVVLLEVRLEHLDGPPAEEHLALTRQALSLHERELGQKAQALLFGLGAFARGVDRLGLLPELERLARETDSRDELLTGLLNVTDGLPARHPERAALLRAAASLAEELGHDAEALTAWTRYAEEATLEADVLRRLATLHERAGNHKELGHVYRRMADGVAESGRAAELLASAGAAYESAGDEASAVEAYQASLALQRSERVLEGLDRLFGHSRRALEQAEVVAQLAELKSVAGERAALHARQGRILEAAGERLEAAQAYAEALRFGQPDEAVWGLERCLAHPETRELSARTLEPVYRAQGEHPKLVELLEAELDTAGESRRTQLLGEIASLREALGDGRLALTARLRAFAQEPHNRALRAELERLALSTDSLDILLGAYEDILERGCSEGVAVELWARVAELYAQPLGRFDLSLDAWERVLALRPREPEVLRGVAEACRRARAQARLAEVLKAQVGLESAVDAQADLLFELAQLAEETLGDKGLALWAYEGILERLPRERSALKSLERLYAQTEAHEALARTLEKDLQLAEETGARDELIELAERLAGVLVGPLARPEQALPLYARILQRQPDHPGALLGVQQLALDEGPVREDARRVLEPLLETTGGYAALVELLEGHVPQEPSAQRRSALLLRLAELRAERLDDPERAFLSAARALRETPGDADALKLTEAHARRSEALEELAALLVEVGPRVTEPEARACLYRGLARLQEELDAPDAALVAWREVLNAQPGDVEALEAQERRLAATGRWHELTQVLTRRLEAEGTGPDTDAVRLRLARALEQGGKDALALDTLKALYGTPFEAEALLLHERLLGRLGRHAEQAEVLARLVALPEAALSAQVSRDSVRVELLCRRGEALLQSTAFDAALAVYEGLAGLAPEEPALERALERLSRIESTRPRAAALLESLYRARGDRARLATALELQVEGAPPERRYALFNELATLREALGGLPAAFSARLRSFHERPDDPWVRDELERLAEAGHLHEELVAAYEDWLERGVSEGLGSSLRRTVARLCTEALDRPSQAIALWETLHAQGPSAEALAALTGLYRRVGDRSRLLEVLEQRVPLEAEAATRADLLLQLGELAEEATGRGALAIDSYRRCLETRPGDRRATEGLARVLSREGRGAELAELLEREISSADGAEARLARLLELARLELGGLQRFESALSRLEEILNLEPGHPGAVTLLEELAAGDGPHSARAGRLLERVYRTRQEPRMLALALQAQLSGEAPSRQLELLDEIARLREALGDSTLAFAARLQAFTRDPGDVRVRAALDRLAEEAGLHEELAAAYEEQLATELPTPLACELWRQVAELHATRLANADAAARAWEKVLELGGGDTAVLSTLEGLYRRLGATRELAQVRLRQAEAEPSLTARVDRLLEVARLAEDELSDLPLATRCCREVLARVPGEPRALEGLDRLLVKTGQYAELAALLDERLRAALSRGAGEEVLDLKVRLGVLRHERLGDSQGALALFEDVLQRRAAHPAALAGCEEVLRSSSAERRRAAELLQPVFERAGEHERTAEVLEVRIETEPDPRTRLSLFHRLAEVHSSLLSSSRPAYEAMARALRVAPGDARTLERTVTLAAAADAGDELAELLSELAPHASTVAEPQAQRGLYRALAQHLEARARLADATDAWAQVLERDPRDAEALGALARLLERQQRWAELAPVLEGQLPLTETQEERAALLTRIGTLQQEVLGEPLKALATFRRALELRERDAALLQRLDRLHEEQHQWSELAGILARRIQVEGDGTGSLRLRLARVKETHLNDRLGAVALLAEVVEHLPSHAEALSELSRVVMDEPHNPRAAEALISAYRRTGQPARLAPLLQARAEHAQEPEARRALWTELSSVHERLGHPEGAFTALAHAVRAGPHDGPARRRLEALAERARLHRELAAALEELLPSLSGQGADVAEVCLTLGALYEQRLEDPEHAVERYERALAASSAVSAPALSALERLYGRLQRWSELAGVLERQAQRVERGGRAPLLMRLAKLSAESLGDLPRALKAYDAVLELEPRHLSALEARVELFEKSGPPERHLEALDRLSGVLEGAARERVRLKMVELAATDLQDRERAVGLCRELLVQNPRSEAAFTRLTELLEAGGDFQALAEALRGRLASVLNPAAQADLRFRLAEVLHRRQGQSEAAVAHYWAVVERAPERLEALVPLRDILEGLDRKDELAQVLTRLVKLTPESEERTALQLRLAEVLTALGRKSEALTPLRGALERPPKTPATLERLHALALSLEAIPEAIRTLEVQVERDLAAGAEEQAVENLLSIAELHRRTKQPRGAGPVLERVLDLEPSHREAYDAAAALYREHEDWAALALLTRRFAEHLSRPERLEAMDALTALYEQKLGRKAEAFTAACEALRLEPLAPSRLATVERLAEETKAYRPLATLFQRIAEGLPRAGVAQQYWVRLAQLQDEQLDDPKAAEETYRGILDFDPGNTAALEKLVDLFERRGWFQALVEVLEQKLEVLDGIDARRAVLLKMAEVFEEKLRQPREAASRLRRAFDLSRDASTAARLVALHKRHGEWNDAVAALVLSRDLAETPSERAGLQLEIALLQEKSLSNDKAAAAAYRKVLEFEPGSKEAFRALERLFLRLERPDELLAVYEHRLSVCRDPGEQIELHLKCAELWLSRRRNSARADACLEAVLKVDPRHLGAIEALAKLRRDESRWEALISVLERQVEATTEPAGKAALYAEMGELYRDRLRDLDRAAGSFSRALQVDEGHRGAMRALATLYERGRRWEPAVELLEREAALLGRTDEAAELFHRIGKLRSEKLKDVAGAKRSHQAALGVSPGHLGALKELRTLCELDSDWAGFEAALTAEAQHTREPEAHCRASLELARFLLDHKRDAEGATRWFEEALRALPTSLEAAGPLADIYLQREEWERGIRMLEVVIGRLGDRASGRPEGPRARELCRQLCRLGQAARQLKQTERALTAFGQALDIDHAHLAALRGKAQVLTELGRQTEALEVHALILREHRTSLGGADVAETHFRMGETLLSLNQASRAQEQLRKALSIDPMHVPSLKALIRIADGASRHEEAAEHRQRLATVVPAEERFGLYTELGYSFRKSLNDPRRAIEAYLRALQLKPQDLATLDALYQVYREARRPRKAVATIEELLAHPEVAPDAERRKRLYLTLADVAANDLHDVERAVDALDRALDLDPSQAEPLSRIEALLTKAQQWKALDAAYQRMMARLQDTLDARATRAALWREVAEVRRVHLKDVAGALEAYEASCADSPGDPAVLEALAEAALQLPSEVDRGLAAYLNALPRSSDPGRACRAVTQVAYRRGALDQAYLAARAQESLVGPLEAGERELLDRLAPQAAARNRARQSLTERMWKEHLLHPSVRGPLGELMAIVYEHGQSEYAADLSEYRLNPKKHRVELDSATQPPLPQLRYVAGLLGFGPVELYSPFLTGATERSSWFGAKPPPDTTVLLQVCHTFPLCLVAGGRFFAPAAASDVYVLIGSTLALLRPELALAQRLPFERLQAVVAAAAALSGGAVPYPVDPRGLRREQKALEKQLSERARVALANVTREYLQEAQPEDLPRFVAGIELTAARAACFVALDPEPVKARLLQQLGAGSRAQSRIRELLHFSLSGDLHALRAATGLALDPAAR